MARNSTRLTFFAYFTYDRIRSMVTSNKNRKNWSRNYGWKTWPMCWPLNFNFMLMKHFFRCYFLYLFQCRKDFWFYEITKYIFALNQKHHYHKRIKATMFSCVRVSICLVYSFSSLFKIYITMHYYIFSSTQIMQIYDRLLKISRPDKQIE